METKRRTLQAVVIRKGAAKSLTVKVEKKQAHPLYGKVVRSHKNFLVHCDDNSVVEVGDLVVIGETKPISKRKTWEFINKVEVTHK